MFGFDSQFTGMLQHEQVRCTRQPVLQVAGIFVVVTAVPGLFHFFAGLQIAGIFVVVTAYFKQLVDFHFVVTIFV